MSKTVFIELPGVDGKPFLIAPDFITSVESVQWMPDQEKVTILRIPDHAMRTSLSYIDTVIRIAEACKIYPHFTSRVGEDT